MSPRFLADENIDPDLVLGLRRRVEGIDILRVQDVGLRTVDDAEILQWAADEGRILISHDFKTIPGFAGERLVAGMRMPGVILLRATLAIAQAIDELAAIAGASDAEEWNNLNRPGVSGGCDRWVALGSGHVGSASRGSRGVAGSAARGTSWSEPRAPS